MNKAITVALYTPHFCQQEWQYDFDHSKLMADIDKLRDEFAPLGVEVEGKVDADHMVAVKGYADLLNAVRIRSPKDGLGNLCLGHIIGSSEACDLTDDIRRGVRRVAFAPETVEPEGSDKIVCHNCGCGC